MLTFVIEVIDVRRAGDLGNEPGGAVGPADKTVPVRRTRFICSQRRKEEVNVQNMESPETFDPQPIQIVLGGVQQIKLHQLREKMHPSHS